jgi:Galactose oxidase, central domain
MAFDNVRNRTVLYGGWTAPSPGTTFFSDTWEWNGQVWTQVSTGVPTARAGHAMVFDSARGKIVMFGRGETWERATSWVLRATTGPAQRANHAMAYDAVRQRVVLFGGRGDSVILGDTWEWDGNTWTEIAVPGPAPREDHAMAYDTVRQVVVLFGGMSAQGYIDDMWEWDGAAWKLRTTMTVPPARAGHAMVFDEGRGRLVVFSGGIPGPINQVDTWEFFCECYADCHVSGTLTSADYACFQYKFAIHDAYADCNDDGQFDLSDFGCFQTKFALGCH